MLRWTGNRLGCQELEFCLHNDGGTESTAASDSQQCSQQLSELDIVEAERRLALRRCVCQAVGKHVAYSVSRCHTTDVYEDQSDVSGRACCSAHTFQSSDTTSWLRRCRKQYPCRSCAFTLENFAEYRSRAVQSSVLVKTCELSVQLSPVLSGDSNSCSSESGSRLESLPCVAPVCPLVMAVMRKVAEDDGLCACASGCHGRQ